MDFREQSRLALGNWSLCCILSIFPAIFYSSEHFQSSGCLRLSPGWHQHFVQHIFTWKCHKCTDLFLPVSKNRLPGGPPASLSCSCHVIQKSMTWQLSSAPLSPSLPQSLRCTPPLVSVLYTCTKCEDGMLLWQNWSPPAQVCVEILSVEQIWWERWALWSGNEVYL